MGQAAVMVGMVGLAVALAGLWLRVAPGRSAAPGAGDTHDLLTGLPTRTHLTTTLRSQLDTGAPASVLLVHFDGYARLNAEHGHDAGDRLLVDAVERIRATARPDETLVRMTGPRVAVVTPALTRVEDARGRAAFLEQALTGTVTVGGEELRRTVTIGGVIADPARHRSPEEVLADLRAAIDEAGRQGGASVVINDGSLPRLPSLTELERELMVALDEDQFEVHYLPVVDPSDGGLVGVEALLRWHRPGEGVVAPDRFLGVLERTAMIQPVGARTMELAVADHARWLADRPTLDLVTTLNVSPVQLEDPAFVPDLLALLARHQLAPERVCLELTSIGDDPDLAWQRLRVAKEAGVQLALDDFGTSSSTFASIRGTSFDVLKVDRTFVNRAATSTEDFAVFQQLVGLAHGLDQVAIAEGVATAAHAEAVVSAGCDLAQGWYWSRPVTAQDLEPMLDAGRVPRR